MAYLNALLHESSMLFKLRSCDVHLSASSCPGCRHSFLFCALHLMQPICVQYLSFYFQDNVWILLEVFPYILSTLPNPVSAITVPCTGLFNNPFIDAKVDDFSSP